MNRLEHIKKTHAWIKANQPQIEFSHALDLFRDQQSNIEWLIDRAEKLELSIVALKFYAKNKNLSADGGRIARESLSKVFEVKK